MVSLRQAAVLCRKVCLSCDSFCAGCAAQDDGRDGTQLAGGSMLTSAEPSADIPSATASEDVDMNGSVHKLTPPADRYAPHLMFG